MPEKFVLKRQRAPQGTIDFAAELNPAQLEAVLHDQGPALIVAGAGTGKTRILVHRVARLVQSGVPPRSILLLTFTRRASREMLDRASALVGSDCAQVAGGTFHSFANLTLRRFPREVGLEPSFTILDRRDAEDVVQFLRSSLELDRREQRFPKKETILSLFSAAVNRSRTVARLVEEESPHLAQHLDALEKLHAAYATYKSQKNLADYDDLLERLRILLREHPAAREEITRRHRYVMVDEYQDTNQAQAEIVERLAGEERNVMAVGDDAQSIYSFRGADFRNMMDFPKRFAGAKVIALEENYRSTQPILDLANAVIERARERYTKVLRTDQGEGVTPVLIRAGSENEQSRFVCQRVLELREEGVALDRIAVLVRSGFHSFDLEIELARSDIPFVKRGGFRFVESAHVKDLLAHMRVLVNPMDGVSWMRALTLLEGIGPKTAGRIAEHVAQAGGSYAALRAERRAGSTADLERLSFLLEGIAERGSLPSDAIDRVLSYYEPILQRAYPDDHPRRARDLENVTAIAARYPTLQAMLADFALDPPSDAIGRGEMASEDEEEGRLTISTIHSSKGLEWHAVFLLWASDGRFPSSYATASDEGIEEERRLCYVAVTRAERELYLSYPAVHYERGVGQIYADPSAFVAGLPEDILTPVEIVEE